LINEIDSVKEDSEITWNSFGGSVYAGQKFIDYLNNKENKLSANVTGIAASMGAAILPFFDSIRGAIQSDIMIHSASGGAKSTLKNSNEFLYNALAKKIDEVKFKEVTGKELKTVMMAEDDERVDVWITGKQAGYIGLFDETYDLLDKAASIKGEINIGELDYQLPENIKSKYGLNTKQNQTNNNDMEVKDVTVDVLQKENKAVYDTIGAAAKTAEISRVAAIMKYAEHDMKKATEIINSGKELSTEDVEYFMEKKFNSEKIDELEEGSEEKLKTAKVTKSEEEKTAEEKEKEAEWEAEQESIRNVTGVETKK
jgi:ATP-dependent protease ClpP protease subunit